MRIEDFCFTVRFDEQFQSGWRLFRLFTILLRPLFDHAEREFGLQPSEVGILLALHYSSPQLSRDLSILTGFRKATIARGKQRLLARGLLFTSAKASCRTYPLHLTSRGRSIAETLLLILFERFDHTLSFLDPTERVRLRRAIPLLAVGGNSPR